MSAKDFFYNRLFFITIIFFSVPLKSTVQSTRKLKNSLFDMLKCNEIWKYFNKWILKKKKNLRWLQKLFLTKIKLVNILSLNYNWTIYNYKILWCKHSSRSKYIIIIQIFSCLKSAKQTEWKSILNGSLTRVIGKWHQRSTNRRDDLFSDFYLDPFYSVGCAYFKQL